MTDNEERWVRPDVRAKSDPLAKLRSEMVVLSSTIGEVARVARRQQLAMLVVALALVVLCYVRRW